MTNVASIHDAEPRPINIRVGANVRIIMQLRGKSQADLAGLIHTTQSSMSRRIKGSTDWAPDEMQKVAQYLNVPVGRLFSELPDLDSNQEPAG